MTIKKQFAILASVIITIPILCIIYISIHNYIRSIDRILVKDFIELKKTDSNQFTKNELKIIRDALMALPLNVDAAIISSQNQVVISSIPELVAKKEPDFAFLWHIQNVPSRQYYYQISVLDAESSKFILVTRVEKNKKPGPRPIGLLPSLMIFLFFIVLICFIMIILIFKSISKSIIQIEQQTQEIANGDLSVEISGKEESNTNEITSICESLEKMRQSLVEAHNQQTKFIMGISHDLRTPVAVIKGYTEALSDGIITEKEELESTYSLIADKTSQLESMIDSLINFMKMNYKDFREQLIPESITQLINEFAHYAKTTGNVFNRNVTTSISLDKDYFIPLNKALINRALENILSNAIRYTQKDDSICIKAEKNENSITISIADTGMGIEEKDLKQIFELFYRGTNSRREEGMGIGLSVVKSIIDTHNWQIYVTSKVNEETCFTIEIPFEE